MISGTFNTFYTTICRIYNTYNKYYISHDFPDKIKA